MSVAGTLLRETARAGGLVLRGLARFVARTWTISIPLVVGGMLAHAFASRYLGLIQAVTKYPPPPGTFAFCHVVIVVAGAVLAVKGIVLFHVWIGGGPRWPRGGPPIAMA